MGVEIRALSKSYGSYRVLHEVTLHARDGRVTGFLGRNGAGKTTTMRCLLGLVSADAGAALIDGRPHTESLDPAQVVGALLSQEAHHPGRSGRDHLRILAASARVAPSRVDAVLREVELVEAADRPAGTYSLGMRQRLHLAGALLGDPGTLVLDEPTNGLDPPGARWLRDRLRGFAAEGRCVLLSSHVLSEVSRTVDDVCVIAEGRIVGAGTLEDVLGDVPEELLVHTDQPQRLEDLLTGIGAGVTRADGEPGVLRVRHVVDAEIARLALEKQVLVTRLQPVERNLEARFLALTEPGTPMAGNTP